MLLRYLKTITLKKSEKTKQPNGSYTETFEKVGTYQAQIQELDDEISASIYGANIVNMLRIKSPLRKLEGILSSKLNNKSDNISKYYIFIGDNQYKIKAVNSKGVDLELI